MPIGVGFEFAIPDAPQNFRIFAQISLKARHQGENQQ
jgi:hypothetical protein